MVRRALSHIVEYASGFFSTTIIIHIEPERSTMLVDGQEVPLSAGMTVKADIITDSRRVIEFFLSPVMKYLNEGLQVRWAHTSDRSQNADIALPSADW